MTRKWKDHKSLVQAVRLFLIDEVKLLVFSFGVYIHFEPNDGDNFEL